jgi:hypothetical protein
MDAVAVDTAVIITQANSHRQARIRITEALLGKLTPGDCGHEARAATMLEEQKGMQSDAAAARLARQFRRACYATVVRTHT